MTNRAKFAQNSEKWAGETLRLPLQTYLSRGGGGGGLANKPLRILPPPLRALSFSLAAAVP